MADNQTERLRFSEYSCTDFAGALAAKRSVPGGGGAVALAGALGVALCSMVGSFTQGKKKYAEYETDIERIMTEAEQIRRRLVELIDDDAAAFEPLSRAYAIPKADPTRVQALEEATKAACAAPVEMVRQCARAVELLEEMAEKGSRMLISDVGCGAALCSAALKAASLTVYVNTEALADRAYAGALEREVDDLLARYVPRADALAATVEGRIRGRG